MFQNITINEGSNLNGTVRDVPLLNLNGMGLATNATTVSGVSTNPVQLSGQPVINNNAQPFAVGQTLTATTTAGGIATDNYTIVNGGTVTITGNVIAVSGVNVATFTTAMGVNANITITFGPNQPTEQNVSDIIRQIQFSPGMGANRTVTSNVSLTTTQITAGVDLDETRPVTINLTP
jgi:hypothetical protein